MFGDSSHEHQSDKGFTDQDHKNGAGNKVEKFDAHDDEFGLAPRKGCTDIIALLMFVVAMVGMTGIGLNAAQSANIDALVNPVDYLGRTCGVDDDVLKKPYGYVVDVQANIVCTKKCPSSTDADGIILGYALSDVPYDPTGLTLADLTGISIDDDVNATYYDKDLLQCKDGVTGTRSVASLVTGSTGDIGVDSDCMFSIESTSVLGYCVITSTSLAISSDPDEDLDIASMLGLSDATSYMMDFLGDIWTAKDYIFGFGFAVALLVGFGFTYVLRIPFLLFAIVWAIILATFCFFLLIGAFMYDTYTVWDAQDPQEKEDYEIDGMKYLAIVFLTIAGLWIVTMICLRDRINLAIALTKVTARAVENLKTIVFLPIILLAAFIVFALTWGMYSLCLMASGEWVTAEVTNSLNETTVTKTWEFVAASEQIQYYMIFCYFWGGEFLAAMGELICALAFACWYFTKDKSTTGMHTVNKAFRVALRYHVGTAAAGSLIIAIIKTIRAFVAKIQKEANKKLGTKSCVAKLAQCALCCLQCCLWCIEKCMKFINKNAYIQTAIYGTTFCTSAKNAFFLIARNIGRIAAVAIVSEVVVFVGKWFIIIVTTALSYLFLDKVLGDSLNSLVGPCIFVAFFAYCIAKMFMSVFSMGISTLLQCFIADEEMYDEHERFATTELQSFIKTSADAAAKKAMKAKGQAKGEGERT